MSMYLNPDSCHLKPDTCSCQRKNVLSSSVYKQEIYIDCCPIPIAIIYYTHLITKTIALIRFISSPLEERGAYGITLASALKMPG